MVKKKLLERSIEQLITLGKKKGYLTYDEINHFLSEEINVAQDFDAVFDCLDKQKIAILEEKEVEDWKRNKGVKEAPSTSMPVDDPVKMYLKQMGQIPLLSRDEEIRLAKEIEEREEALREEIFSAGISRTTFIEISQKLIKEEL
ncbi:MAG: RNA polymerase subunit sigma, partial [Candidatus Omnitrophota bacterium]